MIAPSFSFRRRLLLASAVLLAASPARHSPAQATTGRPIKAVAFDGFVIIDPRPVAMRAEELFPGHGAALMDSWRARQFEYTWLRTLAGRYVDFRQVTHDALVFAAKAAKLELDPDRRDRLMQTFLELKAWPDVAPALRELKDKGLRMAFLANPPVQMLDAVVRNSGLAGLLEPHLSTDRVQAYKPDPRAYQMGIDAFGLSREEIAFAASASWDAAGARIFGYPSFWLNRSNLPTEELGVVPDAIGTGMADLVKFAAR
ncbi:MAG TPA: haloacid dehalogenase type II [Reyranella sp.]|nr:haloacid dehalogenase type II [Reyranella sp.]